MKIIKFALIGFGHIGKRHAEMIIRNQDSELIAIVDILPKEKIDLPNPNIKYFNTLNELIESNIDFDILTIATPNFYHYENALLGLRNKKHVLIEKPISLSKKDAEHLLHEALSVNRQIFCVMQNRYSPPSIWLKEIVESGILGRIFIVQLNCYWNRDERYYTKDSWHGSKKLDGGTLFTQFSHFIDIMYWLFGDISEINGKFENFNHHNLTDFEDSGFINFKLQNGAIGVLNYSTSVWNTNLESSMTIISENGSIKIGGQYMNEVEYCNIKNYKMPVLPPTNPGNDYGHYKGSAQNHNYVIQNVIDVLNNHKSITTNALEGLKVVEIIERIYSKKLI
jgi:predicted dehydrogenase